MDYLTSIRLSHAPIKHFPGFAAKSEMLSREHSFPTYTYLCYCLEDVKAFQPEVFPDLAPYETGTWSLELGIELDSFVPAVDGYSEYCFTFGESEAELCISNRMSLMHYPDKNQVFHLLWPREAPWHGVVELEPLGIPAVEQQLRSIAAMRFEVSGARPDEALGLNLRRCIDQLILQTNKVLMALRESQQSNMPIARIIRKEAVPFVYLLLCGSSGSKSVRLAQSFNRVILTSETLEGDQADEVKSRLKGKSEIDDVDELLVSATNASENGESEIGFLQAVIAAEIQSKRFVRSKCEAAGISKTRLSELRKEMTYALALSVHLPLLVPGDSDVLQELTLAMNQARIRRNDLMHENRFEMSAKEVTTLIGQTRAYVARLKNLM